MKLVYSLISLSLLVTAAQADNFKITVAPQQMISLSAGASLLAEFQMSHDVSTPVLRLENYKPYLHVFDPTGKIRLTKGAGFEFPHHRGIFIGFNKISYQGKKYDRWHMTGGDQVVTEVSQRPDGFTAKIDWQGDTAAAFLTEERSFTFTKPAGPFYLGIELVTTLKPVAGEVTLDGDPEHAGAQFRPSEKIDRTKTTYIFPGEQIDAHKQKDLPWVAEIFSVEDQSFTALLLNHPDNPKETRMSAYRDYGRFGAFPAGTATTDAPMKLHYQWLMAAGEVRDAAVLQKAYNTFAKKNDPVPPLTIKSSEQGKAKKEAKGKDSKDKPKAAEPAK